MATVNSRIRDYLSSTSVPTLAGFIKKEENICIDYVEQFDTVEDAKKNLIRRYSTIHHNLLSKKPNINNVRWEMMFEKAKTKESLKIAAMQGIQGVLPATVKELVGSPQQQVREETEEKDDDDGDDDDDDDDDDDNGDDDFEFRDSAISKETLKAFKRYREESKIIANRKGLSVVNHLQRVLSLSHIMLLKARQHDQGLTNAFTDSKLSDLHKCLRGRYLNKDVTVRDELFLAIKKIVEDVVDEDTTRASAKRELMKLSFDDHDAPIIDMIINCISGLPRFRTSASIGELELITSFLDPILRPLFHDPDQMRLLCWTNRVCNEIDERAMKRPDATMTLRERFHGASALGFCEVKPADSVADMSLCFVDLLRLGSFAKSGIDMQEIKAMMVVQAVGATITFYMMEIMAPAFYPLVQLATVTVPQTLEELPSFLISLSTMKRIHVAYRNHCTKLDADKKAQVGKWKKESLTEEDLADILNPTKSKEHKPYIHL